MLLIQKIRRINDEHFHELRNEKEKDFVEEMFDGVDGLPGETCDEDLQDYLSPRQIEWINDIAVAVGIQQEENGDQ